VIKVIYLIGIVWLGGQGPDGVVHTTRTFNTMTECVAFRPQIAVQIKARWPEAPYHVQPCIEVELDPQVVGISAFIDHKRP